MRGGNYGAVKLQAREGRLKVILTHDIDWPPGGPGLAHILARRDRFDAPIVERVIKEGFNPYNNIRRLMEIEDSHGLRSTFFFRPRYDDGTPISSYADAIKELQAQGWEVGAHLNGATSTESITSERDQIASVEGRAPIGCRVHYLRLQEQSHSYMRRAGFSYDSSVMYSKDKVTSQNSGFLTREGMVVFPITIMDAYLFTYMKVPEQKIVDVFNEAVRVCKNRTYMTVLWHDSSLMMIGGRMYGEVCEMLATREDVDIVTARDAFLSASAETRN
jgi:hypothetical protein